MFTEYEKYLSDIDLIYVLRNLRLKYIDSVILGELRLTPASEYENMFQVSMTVQPSCTTPQLLMKNGDYEKRCLVCGLLTEDFELMDCVSLRVVGLRGCFPLHYSMRFADLDNL